MEIVDFRPEHAAVFRALNEDWILKHLGPGAQDQALGDPQGEILDRGGRIFMALEHGEAVGCVALTPLADGGLEVSNMTVAEGRRGAGLGRALVQRCLDEAVARRAPRLYLEADSALGPALSLYRAMGFTPLSRVRESGGPIGMEMTLG